MPDERNKMQGPQGEQQHDGSQKAPGRNPQDDQSLGGKQGDRDRRGDQPAGDERSRQDGGHKEGGQNETRR